MQKFLNHTAKHFRTAYTGLFKAAMVMFTLFLLAWTQMGPFLYEKEMAAHKTRFEFEVRAQQPYQTAQCNKLDSSLQVSCLSVKHEMNTISELNDLFQLFLNLFMWLGIALCVFSAVSFAVAPYIPNNDQSSWP